MMHRFFTSTLVLLALIATASSAPDPKSSPDPATPAESNTTATSFRLSGGNAERGEAAFVALACVQCHSVKGSSVKQPKELRLDLELASEVRFVKGYLDILTAITNPRHVMTEQYQALLKKDQDVEPFMPVLTEKMTARQLIDLVEFLDETYREQIPGYGK